MKKIVSICVLSFLLLYKAFSLEIGIDFLGTNANFLGTQTAPLASVFPTTNFFYGINVWGTETVSDVLSLNANFLIDPILRNVFLARIEYTSGFLHLSVGPFFGLFNSPTSFVKSGLSSEILVDWPGVVFARGRSDTSLGGALRVPGDYLQEQSTLQAGVYVPNAIVSLEFNSKKYQYQSSASTIVADSQTEYLLLVDMFKKNTPYNLLMTIGYRQFSKSFVTTVESIDTIASVLVGSRITIRPIKELSIVLDGEMPLYTLGLDGLKGFGPASSSVLYKFSLGLSWAFAKEKAIINVPEASIDAKVNDLEGEVNADTTSDLLDETKDETTEVEGKE